MSDKSKTVRMRRWRRRKLVRSRVIRVEITEVEIAALGRIGYKPEKQDDAAAIVALLLARLERLRIGQRGHSPLMQALFFGAFNKPFAPARTPFDWLSRDSAEVDKYIADPLCGFEATVQLYIDVLQGLRETAKPSRQARIPKTLPIYILNGSRDPVSDNVDQLLDAYRAAGLTQVVHKVYSDGRHESFNETNRDVVTRDLIAWLDGVIDRCGRIAKDT